METGLALLMRDGAVHVGFLPRLTPEQYAELTKLVDRASTKAELRDAMIAAAERWGCELTFDETP